MISCCGGHAPHPNNIPLGWQVKRPAHTLLPARTLYGVELSQSNRAVIIGGGPRGTSVLERLLAHTASAGGPEIVSVEATRLLEEMRGRKGHIFNLGHGVPPTAKLECIESLVATVRNFK